MATYFEAAVWPAMPLQVWLPPASSYVQDERKPLMGDTMARATRTPSPGRVDYHGFGFIPTLHGGVLLNCLSRLQEGS
jgi:hypothetical protein